MSFKYLLILAYAVCNVLFRIGLFIPYIMGRKKTLGCASTVITFIYMGIETSIGYISLLGYIRFYAFAVKIYT